GWGGREGCRGGGGGASGGRRRGRWGVGGVPGKARGRGHPSSWSVSAGACQPPIVSSRYRATASATSSRDERATTWTPMGMPSFEVPVLTTTHGQPQRLKGSV